MSNDTISLDRCAVCEQNCSSKCSNCRKVAYCSKAHQKKDRKGHKNDCYPAKVEKSPVLGRYLVATRDLSEDEVVLRETPLFSGPNGNCGIYILCLSCYGLLKEEDRVLCKRCKWPMHPGCQDDPLHLENECGIFSKSGFTFGTLAIEQSIYDKLMVLRGLLLKLNDRVKWDRVLSLQSHREERLSTEIGKRMSKTVVNFVHKSCRLESQFTEEEVDHVLGVVITNAFATEDNLTTSPGFRSGLYVFTNMSMLAHSCIPNCKWIIEENGQVQLRTLHPIKEDDVLYICYAWGGMGTLERQENLKRSKHFVCTCARCIDPTESGSFYSAIKCRKCSDYLLPGNPLDDKSAWICSSCKSDSMTSEEVQEMVESIRNEVGLVPMDPTVECVLQLEKFREKLLTKVHPNHFILHEVEQDMLSRLSYLLSQGETKEKIEQGLGKEEKMRWAVRLVELSKNALAVANIIAPGVSTHIGRQLYFQQQGLGLIITDKISNNSSSPELRKLISEWQELRRRGVQILSWERQGREEYVYLQSMKEG